MWPTVAIIVLLVSGVIGYIVPDKVDMACAVEGEWHGYPAVIARPATRIGVGLKEAFRSAFGGLKGVGDAVEHPSGWSTEKVELMIAAFGVGYFIGYDLKYVLFSPACEEGKAEPTPFRQWKP